MIINKYTLIILAAGLATRYGSLKQLDPIGKYGETIMDYSIYDAIQSGFKKIVFIIRDDFFKSFKNRIEKRWKGKIELQYAIQSMTIKYNKKIIIRDKPWGTGHALLSAKNFINEPFCVINADDFYGRESFHKMYEFLNKNIKNNFYAMIGFELYNTLSKNGSVSRGICKLNHNKSMFKGIEEKKKIFIKSNKIISKENELEIELDKKTLVSMNFWGLNPNIFSVAEIMFAEFLDKNFKNPKSEFLLPDLLTHEINNQNRNLCVIKTSSKWFGITYKKDKKDAINQLNKLIKKKLYPNKL